MKTAVLAVICSSFAFAGLPYGKELVSDGTKVYLSKFSSEELIRASGLPLSSEWNNGSGVVALVRSESPNIARYYITLRTKTGDKVYANSAEALASQDGFTLVYIRVRQDVWDDVVSMEISKVSADQTVLFK